METFAPQTCLGSHSSSSKERNTDSEIVKGAVRESMGLGGAICLSNDEAEKDRGGHGIRRADGHGESSGWYCAG